VVILGAIGVFAGVMYGVMTVRESGVTAPMAVMVDGKAFPLRQGRVFIYFFDPECAHCDQAARHMAQFVWKDVRVLAVATAQPKWARVFLDDTKFPAALTYDVAELRKAFKFTDTPYGVALVNGRVAGSFPFFDEREPAAGLRQAGFID
jgi:thiol-disulfide isomerase/thioredoxin